MKRSTLIAFFFCAAQARLQAIECLPRPGERVTDDFYFTASSDQGAVGDVVAVDIALTVENLRPSAGSAYAVVCYDPAKAELLEEPLYSEAYDSLFFLGAFVSLPPVPFTGAGGERGFQLGGLLQREAAARLLGPGNPVYLATVFFRLKGAPGDAFQVAFCDNVLGADEGSCKINTLLHLHVEEGGPLTALSTRHVAGEVRILEGEPTRPEPPALPPLARVYPEPPTAETSDIRFELSGAAVQPGATEVPLALHITSNYEWCGFAVSLTFPAESLELARVVEHTRPALLRIDNTEGALSMLMWNSPRRLGAEWERVRLATLYFNVKPAAPLGAELRPKFEAHRAGVNLLVIRTMGGINTQELPILSEVEPLVLTDGVLKIQELPTALGDVNLDYEVNITDPVALLNALFLGVPLLCPEAADFTADGEVNITDPIAILNFLFLGGPAAPPREVFCNAR